MPLPRNNRWAKESKANGSLVARDFRFFAPFSGVLQHCQNTFTSGVNEYESVMAMHRYCITTFNEKQKNFMINSCIIFNIFI